MSVIEQHQQEQMVAIYTDHCQNRGMTGDSSKEMQRISGYQY